MKASEITKYLEEYFPLNLQQPWDKCGLQIGDLNQSVHKIMIGLNADNETLTKAIEEKCDMLITHHPFLFEPINQIDVTKHQGEFIARAIKNNVIIYSLHTCLDTGINPYGMNYWLINKLGVKNISEYNKVSIGKKGDLIESYTVDNFIKHLKDKLNISNLRYSRGFEKKINSVAICGGSGADEIEDLVNQVDVYITGDTKYRHAKYAIDNDILLIDIGHHAEVIMEEEVKNILDNLEVEIITANSLDYYIYK